MPNEPLWTRMRQSSNMRRYPLGPLAIFIGLVWATGVWAQLAPGVTEHAIAVSELLGRSVGEVRSRIGARIPEHDYVSEVRLISTGEVVVRDSFDIAQGGGPCAPKSGLSFTSTSHGHRPLFPRFYFQHERLQEMRDLTGNASIPADQSIRVLCVPTSTPTDVAAWIVFGPWSALAAVAQTPETLARARTRANLARLRLGQPPPRGLAVYAAHPPAGVQVQVQAPGRASITVNLGRDKTTKAPDLVRAEVADGRIVAISKAQSNFVPCWIERDSALHCGATAAPL